MSHAWPSFADCSPASFASDELLWMCVFIDITQLDICLLMLTLVLPYLTGDDAYVIYVNIYIT